MDLLATEDRTCHPANWNYKLLRERRCCTDGLTGRFTRIEPRITFESRTSKTTERVALTQMRQT